MKHDEGIQSCLRSHGSVFGNRRVLTSRWKVDEISVAPGASKEADPSPPLGTLETLPERGCAVIIH